MGWGGVDAPRSTCHGMGIRADELRVEVPRLVIVGWRGSGGVCDVSVVAVECLVGFVGTGLGGVPGLLDPVEPFIAGLFVLY